jgi:hypothetical protein
LSESPHRHQIGRLGSATETVLSKSLSGRMTLTVENFVKRDHGPVYYSTTGGDLREYEVHTRYTSQKIQ